MQVMCICRNGWGLYYKSGRLYKDYDGPKYGEICTVIGESDDNTAYILSEYSNSEGLGYSKVLFIPLSDKDEMSYADEVMEKIFVPVEKPTKTLT